MKLTSKGLYCGSFVLLLERGAKTREGRESYLQLSLGPLSALTAVMSIFLIFRLSVAPTKLSARNEVGGGYG